MKTIEEAANEYQEYSMNNLAGAFKAGAEFAQRWIPVEEELPEYSGECFYVLGKWRVNNDTFLFLIDSKVECDNIQYVFSHWRPIEVK